MQKGPITYAGAFNVMSQLSEHGKAVVSDLAARHGFSQDAVLSMLISVSNGYGSQAQFNHPEFGGMGQWSMGGMIMIGDMFNNQLKGRVGNLCSELSSIVQGQPLFAAPAQSQSQSQGGYGSSTSMQMQGGGLFAGGGNWWPGDLGSPSSSGAQNDMRYAYFPGSRRLAVSINGEVSVYDTGDHQIGGVSQQQGGGQSATFTSQYGTVRLLDLPIVSGPGARRQGPSISVPPMSAPSSPAQAPAPQPPPAPSAPSAIDTQSRSSDVIGMIEKLAALHKSGILTDAEFEAKKAELLSRL